MAGSDTLSEGARALITARIIAGDSNARINAALRDAKLIDAKRTVSDNALTPYRQSDDVRVEVRRLSSEAIQVGHAALSAAIVAHTDIMRETEKILLPYGAFPASVDDRHALAEKMFYKSSKFLWDALWSAGLPESIKEEGRLAELARRMEHADVLPEDQRLLIVVEVRETLNRMLAAIVAERRQGQQGHPVTLPVRAVVSPHSPSEIAPQFARTATVVSGAPESPSPSEG